MHEAARNTGSSGLTIYWVSSTSCAYTKKAVSRYDGFELYVVLLKFCSVSFNKHYHDRYSFACCRCKQRNNPLNDRAKFIGIHVNQGKQPLQYQAICG